MQVLPGLSAGCRNFSSSAEKLASERAQNRHLLQQHTTLLDLLEVPQLMDTCVRNGNYDEALDLEGSMSKLVTQQPGAPWSEFPYSPHRPYHWRPCQLHPAPTNGGPAHRQRTSSRASH